jgi:hypothetical protein
MIDREPSDGWETATWEGLRREQLRRSLRLTVRERLQALEAMAETSAWLVEVGRRARERARHEAE